MKSLPILIIYQLVWVGLSAQINLVPNASFEEKLCCPHSPSQIYCCKQIDEINGSSDFYHLCDSSQYSSMLHSNIGEPPRTDSGVVGFYFDGHTHREYIYTQLNSTLSAGGCYEVSFWLTPRNHNKDGCDHIAALFTNTPPQPNHPVFPTMIIDTPQIQQKDSVITNVDRWTQVRGSFIADGNERFITLGVFAPKDSVNHAIINPHGIFHGYYLLDDVAVYPCDAPVDSANAGPDAFFCTGDSVQLGTHALPEYRYYWYIDTVLVSREARPVFAPTQTTTYTLLVKDFKFDETRDTVTAHWVNCDTIPTACAGEDRYICKGDSVALGCYNRKDFTFQWSIAEDSMFSTAAQPLVYPQTTTTYVVRQQDYTLHYSTDSIRIKVVDCSQIVADAGNDTTICLGDSLKLGGLPVEGVKYLWLVQNTPLDSASQIWVQPGESVQYKLEMLDPRKTLYEDWCNVSVIECDIPLTIPNVFSPNGDGINDFFQIENPRNAAYELLIFNRWGALILETNHDKLWDGTVDGKPVASGTYFYSLTATLPPYRTTRLQGTVMVLRH